MKTLKITKIFRTTKDKEGKPLINREGRPFERVAIKCQEYGDRWISGFGSIKTNYWSVGTEVEVKVTENASSSGQMFLNFSLPSVWDEIREIKQRLEKLENGRSDYEIDNETLEKEIKEDDLPF